MMRILRAAIVVVLALYLIDTLWFYLRKTVPKLGAASGSVHRIRLLAIADKGGKTAYEVDEVTPEEDVPCAHAIFPHASESPCWYVIRHAKDPIPM